MTVLITLTIVGSDSGPFDLYSSNDGFITPFETNISKSNLVSGYESSLVPDYTVTVRVKSKGDCINYIDIPLQHTTTTSTSSSTTTTTTTEAPSQLCYNYTVATYTTGGATYTDCNGIDQSVQIGGTSGYDSTSFCALDGTVQVQGNAFISGTTDCIL